MVQVQFPFTVCRVKVFVQQRSILRYEEATTVPQLLVRIHETPTVTNTIFLSHKWLRSRHPDDIENTKFNQILRLLGRSNLREIEYVWIDYSCVPQDNEQDKEKAINSFADYVQLCTHFVILVGSEGPRTLVEYNKRGWCRLERFAARTPAEGRFLLHIFVHNGSDDTFSEALSVAGANPTDFAEVNPLEGKFSGDARAEIIRIAPALLHLCTKIKACPRDDNHYEQAAYITNSLFQPMQRTEDVLLQEHKLQVEINELKAARSKPKKSRRQIQKTLTMSEFLKSLDSNFDGNSLWGKSEQVLIQELQESRLMEKLVNAGDALDAVNLIEKWLTALNENNPMGFDAFNSCLLTQTVSHLSPKLADFLFCIFEEMCSNVSGMEKWQEAYTLNQFVDVANRVCAIGGTGIPIVTAGIFKLLRKDVFEGTISRKEFLVVLLVVFRAVDMIISSVRNVDILAGIKTVFEMVDANEDGNIDVEETEEFLINLLRIPAKLPQTIALGVVKVFKSAARDDPLYDFVHMVANAVAVFLFPEFSSSDCIQVQALSDRLCSMKSGIPTEWKQELLRIFPDRSTTIDDAADACTRKAYDLVVPNVLKKLEYSSDKIYEQVLKQLRTCLEDDDEAESKDAVATKTELTFLVGLVLFHFYSYLKGPGMRKALRALISLLDLKNTGLVQQSVINLLVSMDDPTSLSVHICEFFSVFEKGRAEIIEKQELVEILVCLMGKISELLCDCCFILDDLVQVLRAVLMPVLSFVANIGDGTSASLFELFTLPEFMDSLMQSKVNDFLEGKKLREEETQKKYR